MYLGGCVAALPALLHPEETLAAALFIAVAVLFTLLSLTMLARGPFEDPAVAAMVAEARASGVVDPA